MGTICNSCNPNDRNRDEIIIGNAPKIQKNLFKDVDLYFESDYMKEVIKLAEVDGFKLRKERLDDGSYYKGYMLDGKQNGPGVLMSIDGSRYEGNWKDGLKEGEG